MPARLIKKKREKRREDKRERKRKRKIACTTFLSCFPEGYVSGKHDYPLILGFPFMGSTKAVYCRVLTNNYNFS